MEYFNDKLNMIKEGITSLRQDIAWIHGEYPHLKANTDFETQVQAGNTPAAPSKGVMDEFYYRMDVIDEKLLEFAGLVDITDQLPQFAAVVIAARMLKVELELILFAIWTNNPDRLQQDFRAWFDE
ncbi:hypothetical protein ACHAPA_004767 [Fusarium lateritium]